MIFVKLDGVPWMQRPLSMYPKYVGDDMMQSLRDDNARVKRTPVDVPIALSCHIKCYQSLHQGMFDHLAAYSAPSSSILVYDREMPVSVNVQNVQPRKLAAVRREVAPGAVGSAWGPAVGKVWDFIRSQPGLWTDGHNIFLYRHSKQPGAPILCDFGVEVTRTFETAGEVYATETPEGEAAVAVHRGPYNRMHEA